MYIHECSLTHTCTVQVSPYRKPQIAKFTYACTWQEHVHVHVHVYTGPSSSTLHIHVHVHCTKLNTECYQWIRDSLLCPSELKLRYVYMYIMYMYICTYMYMYYRHGCGTRQGKDHVHVRCTLVHGIIVHSIPARESTSTCTCTLVVYMYCTCTCTCVHVSVGYVPVSRTSCAVGSDFTWGSSCFHKSWLTNVHVQCMTVSCVVGWVSEFVLM
jgi:hypothetical protein